MIEFLNINFHNWVPGLEYKKKLWLRNRGQCFEVISFKLPTSPYFVISFPDPLTIPSGMSCCLNVLFRPLNLIPYEDQIEFFGSCSFRVKITAHVPNHNLEITQECDFGTCAVEQVSKLRVKLRNLTDLSTFFEWKIQPPFEIVPLSGVIGPKESKTMIIKCIPLRAGPCETIAYCLFEKRCISLRCKVTAKYPYLLLKTNNLDLGNVPFGTIQHKELFLENKTSVESKFSILGHDQNDEFSLDPINGKVAPFSTKKIKIMFKSVMFGPPKKSAHFLVCSPNFRIPFSLYAECLAPELKIAKNLMRFPDIRLGKKSTKQVFFLQNSSDTNYAIFEIQVGRNSTFKFRPSYGKVEPNSSLQITVEFCPSWPINYFRRINIIVLNSKSLFIDVMGTCFNDDARPPPLHAKHVINTLKIFTDELYLQNLEKKITQVKSGQVSTPLPDVEDEINGEKFDHLISMVTASTNLLNFDQNQKTMHFSLKSEVGQDLRLYWTQTKGVFSITPQTCVLSQHSSMEFEVEFHPKGLEECYDDELECFLCLDYMRNFRNIAEEKICSPWFLSVRVQGNSISSFFLPDAHLSTSKIVFPPACDSNSIKNTFSLSNFSDCALMYKFISEENKAFGVIPVSGVVSPKSSRLIEACFHTQESDAETKTYNVLLNGIISKVHKLELVGYSFAPKIKVPDLVYIPPVLSKMSGSTEIILENHCPYTQKFRFMVLSDVLKVEPMSGEIQGTRSIAVKFVFCSLGQTKKMIKVELYSSLLPSDKENKSVITVACSSVQSNIEVEKFNVKLENVPIKVPFHSKDIVILNQSECLVSLKLRSSSELVKVPETLNIPAQTRTLCPISIFLNEAKEHKFTIQIKSDEWVDLCVIEAKGTYPMLQVVHVYGDSPSYEIFTACNIKKINQALRFEQSKVVNVYFRPNTSTTVWVLQNTGVVKFKWRLEFPKDPENNQRAPQVVPESGCLDPGSIQKISIVTNCSFQTSATLVAVGEKGFTVCAHLMMQASDPGCLYHCGDDFSFGETGISQYPVTKYMRLYNTSQSSAMYNIDLSQVDSLSSQFPVFQCKTPSGMIPPNSYQDIEWAFHPIQIRTYSAMIQIQNLWIKLHGECTKSPSLAVKKYKNFNVNCDQSTLEVLVRPHTVCSRVVMLKNPLKYSVPFVWSPQTTQVVFQPWFGTIPAQSHVYCRLYIRGSPQPSQQTHLFVCSQSQSNALLNSEKTELTVHVNTLIDAPNLLPVRYEPKGQKQDCPHVREILMTCLRDAFNDIVIKDLESLQKYSIWEFPQVKVPHAWVQDVLESILFSCL